MVGNVGRQFGRRLFQDRYDGMDNTVQRLFQSRSYFLRIHIGLYGKTRFRTATAHVGHKVATVRNGRADEHFQLFGRTIPDGYGFIFFQIANNRFIEGMTADTQGFADNDTAEA